VPNNQDDALGPVHREWLDFVGIVTDTLAKRQPRIQQPRVVFAERLDCDDGAPGEA
jgi:hypothetical protein